MPAALLNVRSTTRLSRASTLEARLAWSANSTYASSEHHDDRQREEAVERGVVEPAAGGIVRGGEEQEFRAVRFGRGGDPLDVRAEVVEPGTWTTSAPASRASKLYIPNVGGALITASPGARKRRQRESSSSSAPCPEGRGRRGRR